METRFIKVVHNGDMHSVGLYTGISPVELSKLLTTVFCLGPACAARKAVVGFQDDNGTVLPISLACVAPTLLSPSGSYKLLLTDSDSFFGLASPAARSSPTLVTCPATEPCAQVRAAADWVVPAPSEVQSQALPTHPGNVREAWAPPAGEESRHETEEVAEKGQEADEEDEEEEEEEEGGDEDEEEEEEDDDDDDDDDESTGSAVLNEETTQKLLRFAELLSLQHVLSTPELEVICDGLQRGSRVLSAAYQVAQAKNSVELLSHLWKTLAGNATGEDGLKLVILAQENLLEILNLLKQAQRLTHTQYTNLQHLVLVQHEGVAGAYDQFRTHDDLEALTAALCQLADDAENIMAAQDEAGASGEEDEEGQEADEGQCESRRQFEEVVVEMGVHGEEKQFLGEWLMREFDRGSVHVRGAWDSYQADGDRRRLFAVLFRILQIEVNKRATQAASAAAALSTNTVGRKDNRPTVAATAAALPPSTTTPATGGASTTTDASRWEGKVAADLVLLVLRLAKAQALTLQDGEDALDLIALGPEEGEEEDKDGRTFVKAAWDVYQLEKDPADFVDTVTRAVRVWREKRARRRPMVLQSRSEAEAELTIMRRSILAQCLDILIGQRAIDLPGFRALVRLLDGGSDVVQAAIDAFLVDEDVEELLDTLRLIAVHAAPAAPASASADGPKAGGPKVGKDGKPPRHDVRATDSKPAAGQEAIGGGSLAGVAEGEGECDSLEEDVSFASDRAVKCSGTSVASYSSLFTLEDDRGEGPEAAADAEREEVLHGLVANGGLSEQEGSFLSDMLLYSSRERPLLNAILADYMITRDAALLTGRLKELVNLLAGRSFGPRSIGELSAEGIEEEEDEEEEDAEDEDGLEDEEEEMEMEEGQEERLVACEERQGAEEGLETITDVDRLFLEIVADMDPSNLETAALRLCLARKDENLTSALELYRATQDADDFKDTLRRVARQTILEISRELPDDVEDEALQSPAGDSEIEDARLADSGRGVGFPTGNPSLASMHPAASAAANGPAAPQSPLPTSSHATGYDERENVGDCHKQQEVLSELVGQSYLSSEERERVLSFTGEVKEVLASAIHAYDLKEKTAEDLAATLRELLIECGDPVA